MAEVKRSSVPSCDADGLASQAVNAGEATPVAPIYRFRKPGAPIELFRGPARLDTESFDDVRIWASMKHGVQIKWRIADTGWSIPLDSNEMIFNHPSYGETRLPVRVNGSQGRGDVSDVLIGRPQPVVRIQSQWANILQIHPSTMLKKGNRRWAGRWEVAFADWHFTLEGRPDLTDAIRRSRVDDEPHLLTHVGILRHANNLEFDTEMGLEVLHGLQVAISFALGRWVAPCCSVGLNAAGQRVVEEWAPWRCDTLFGYLNWWDTHQSADLAAFVTAFMESYLDEQTRTVFRYAAIYAISANHSGTTTEAKLILAQAALEYLAWVDRGLGNVLTKSQFDDLNAAQRIDHLLKMAGIPSAVPVALPALARFAETEGDAMPLDGPESITRARNRLIHPKDPTKSYEIDGLLWQATQLAIEYLELLILSRVGYQGSFKRRYPLRRFEHASEPVPWAVKT